MVSQLKCGVIECSAAAEGVANTAVREPWPFTASLLWHLCSCSPSASGVTRLLFLHSRCWCAGLLAWLGSISSSTGNTEWSQLSWQPGHCAYFISFLFIPCPHVFHGAWLFSHCPWAALCALVSACSHTSLCLVQGAFPLSAACGGASCNRMCN